MPNILVLGAAGYIGQAVAHALTSSGKHTVYGLARTPEKAKILSSLEVIPVMGSIHDSAAYLELIRTAPIDLVIDVAAAFTDSHIVLSSLLKAGRERNALAAASGIASPKLGFIYCSGIWVHGDSEVRVSDLTPVGVMHAPAQPSAIVNWRPRLEQEIISAETQEVLDTMVLRPALVYGRAGGSWGAFFKPICDAARKIASTATVAADPAARPALVHVDDVGKGFLAAAGKLPLLAGTGVYPIFDLVTSQENLEGILQAAARELGFKGKLELVGPGDNAFMEAMNASVSSSSARAVDILGWAPTRIGMLQGMDAFAKAWQTGPGGELEN
jgi:nucleoside-diphosphate-sugar epimerase